MHLYAIDHHCTCLLSTHGKQHKTVIIKHHSNSRFLMNLNGTGLPKALKRDSTFNIDVLF